MDKTTLESWLAAGYADSRMAAGVPSTSKWPLEKAQEAFTSWATAFFFHASNSLCAGSNLVLQTTAGQTSQAVIARMLVSSRITSHNHRQSIVDYSVINKGASEPIQLTAESECNTQQSVGAEMNSSNEYSWDFYKLLVVPSPSRLFFACVGGGGPKKGQKPSQRRQQLLQSLRTVYEAHSSAFMRPTDVMGGFIVAPAAKDRMDTYCIQAAKGRFEFSLIVGGLRIGP